VLLLGGLNSAAGKEGGQGMTEQSHAFLNIKDFGAKGDGKADDTAALLAVMDKAASESGSVWFPTGTYCIQPVKVPSHITLRGDSNWAYENKGKKDPGFEGRTTLKALSGDARALLDCYDTRGTRIIGLTLDGDRKGDAMHGIYVRHTGCELHMVIEDCRINHFTGSGIRLEKAWVFAVRRCLIMWNGGHGIDCTGGYDGWVIDTMLTANKGAGFFARGEAPEEMSEEEKQDIRFFGSASVMLTASRIEWNRGGGIILNGANSMQINGCSIDHNFGPGILMTNSIANTVTGCIIRTSGVDCEGEMSCQIRLEDCSGTTVSGNTLWGWFERGEYNYKEADPLYGIIVKNLKGCVVSQNALYHSSSVKGILDHGGHEATVIENNPYVKPEN
jgi:parallel beta-helix repeat protein